MMKRWMTSQWMEQIKDLPRAQKWGMLVSFPIFQWVAQMEMRIARRTGCTYKEINIIVFYMLIPLSWFLMVDYITRIPFLTPLFVIGWGVFLWKDSKTFSERCDWGFRKSVEFLLWFKSIGWNYIVSSVIICVFVPIGVFSILLYFILR